MQTTMTAVTFREGAVALDDVPVPRLQDPTDAVVRVTTSAICGSDLHITRGLVPGMREGSVIGHEFVGIVEQVGSEVPGLREGDRVLGSCMVPCGQCHDCRRGAFGRCPVHRVLGYGAYTGDLDGAQAEFVRVPIAAVSLKRLEGITLEDDVVLPVGDVLTTGMNVAAEGHIQPGQVVVVQGLGPVGLFALQAARTFGPRLLMGVDPNPLRRAVAASMGTIALDATPSLNEQLLSLTKGRGADVVLECAGGGPALEQALATVRPGGRVSVIGVPTEVQWTTSLAVHFRRGVEIKLCGTTNVVGLWDRALTLLQDGIMTTEPVLTHRLALDEAITGYDLLHRGDALKVLLHP